MTIAKKSLVVFLALVFIVLGLELAVKYLSNFDVLRERIVVELSERLEADVKIKRVGLDVLPIPHLELHDVRLEFLDGSLLSVPLIELSLSLRGLFSGSPQIATIDLEEPEARMVIRAQEPESAKAQETRRKEQAAYIDSLLQSVPFGITIHDGTLHVIAPDNSPLALEKVEAKVVALSRGLRVSGDCSSVLWENLAFTITYQDPEAVLEIEARDMDIVKSNAVITAFAGGDLPAADIRQNLHGLLSSLSLRINLPRISDSLENAVISGRGSFEDISLSLSDMDLDVRDLDGDFELNDGNITAQGISARFGNSRIQEAAVHLDGAREFKPSRVTAKFNLDLSDVPGWLHWIPDPDVRNEIALIKDPRGAASGTFELHAEGDNYSTDIAVSKLELQSNYRAFPSTLTLQAGRCSYRDDLLSFNSFSGQLGASSLPDFSLSFSLADDEHFTAAAKGATIALGELRSVLDSFDESRELVENSTHAEGRATIVSLAFEGPLTEPKKWTIAVDAQLDDVSVSDTGLDGPLAISSGMLKADQKTCTLSQAYITYLDARLTGSCTLEDYFNGMQKVIVDGGGTLDEVALEHISSLCDLPSVLALRAPVKIERSRFEWSRGGAATVVGDFVLGGKSKVGLSLMADSAVLDIKELTIRDAVSQCTLGMKIEKDILSLSYVGMLKKDTLDRLLLNNRFLQGWLQGDISLLFNQKNPRGSSAKGTLAWEKAGYPAFDTLPFNLTSAKMTARDKLLTIDSAGLSTGQDSAGVQGSVGFTDDGFVLDLVLEAESIDVDEIADRLDGDNASDGSSAAEFWETPLRGTVRFKVQELKKDAFICTPLEAIVSFADRAVTVNTEGTKLCSVSLPATALITPDSITLDVQAGAEKSPMQDLVRCLSGERDLITGVVDVDADMSAQATPDDLLDSLEGGFSIRARDGRIYQSGLITKIVSFMSIRNLLRLSVRDMVKSGYAYQSWDIDGDIKGRVLEVQKAILISDSFTLVCRGTINLENDKVDLDALATPFQIQNQVLSKVPLIGGWLSKPVLGVPLKIQGTVGDVQISTRTTAAVYKGLVDITKGVLKLPVRIISPVLPKKSSDEK